MLSNKSWGGGWWGAAVWGLTGHWLIGGEQLFSFASLVFLGFYFPLSLFFCPLFLTI